MLGPVDSPYWQHNPDSAKNQPRRLPGVMPVLSTDEAAARIVAAVTKTRRQVVSPPVFRLLFLLTALFPRITEAVMRA